MNAWNKFWKWYENKILGSIIIIAIIQFIQVPHMVWNADIMLEAGIVSRVHPVIDWFLYGVDLIEIISIVNEEAFLHLEAPPKRVSAFDVIAPLPQGEHFYMQTPDKIFYEIEKTVKF